MSFRFTSLYLDDPLETGRVMDLFVPDRITQEVALFFVHGGGWAGGTRTIFHPIMRGFNRQGYLCASADYRLCGKGITLFDQLTDLRQAYDRFVTELLSMGRPLRIFTLGGSAGAHLNALMSLAEPGACGESLRYAGKGLDHEWVRPIGLSLASSPARFEPWEDIFPGIWDSMQLAVGKPYSERPDLYERAAPIRYIDTRSSPVLFLHADDEYMFPLRYLVEFQQRMQALGRRCEIRRYSNAEHGFFYDLTRRQQKEAFADVLSFLDSL
ncbi:MAG: alpha/beta hydrolase [Kiritimatiellia bacterium]|nr:alpha/beta hydrolase [Kiritimatiellia bacterium]